MDSPPAKKKSAGAPAWIMTFADLMSLLLAFFVLLFSFSEVDNAKYKEVGGSLQEAFGVQREIQVRDPIMGTTLMAREFGSGRQKLTVFNEMQQSATNLFLRFVLQKDFSKGRKVFDAQQVMRSLLEIADAKLDEEQVDAKKAADDIYPGGVDVLKAISNVMKSLETSDKAEEEIDGGPPPAGKELGTGAMADEQLEDPSGEKLRISRQTELLDPIEQTASEEEDPLQAQKEAAEMFRKELAHFEIELDRQSETNRKILDEFEKQILDAEYVLDLFRQTAAMLKEQLKEAIDSGEVELLSMIDLAEQRIIIRMSDAVSFESGRADLSSRAIELLKPIANIIPGLPGTVEVSGHTDSVPIRTARFRSNWDLSAARAASVAETLMHQSKSSPYRFVVRGLAHTQPLESNDTAYGRSKNRRVEIAVIRGEDWQTTQLSRKQIGTEAANTASPDKSTSVKTLSSEPQIQPLTAAPEKEETPRPEKRKRPGASLRIPLSALPQAQTQNSLTYSAEKNPQQGRVPEAEAKSGVEVIEEIQRKAEPRKAKEPAAKPLFDAIEPFSPFEN